MSMQCKYAVSISMKYKYAVEVLGSDRDAAKGQLEMQRKFSTFCASFCSDRVLQICRVFCNVSLL